MAKDYDHKRLSTDQNLFGVDDHKTYEGFAKKHLEAFHKGAEMEEKRCHDVEDEVQRRLGKRDKKDRKGERYDD